MTTLIRSMASGFRRCLSRPLMVLGVWLVNLIVALPMAGVLAVSIGSSIRGTDAERSLTEGFELGWFGEYAHLARGVETTFEPQLIGGAAFLDNLEGWATGELFHQFGGLIAVGAIYLLVWALLLGGILDRFARAAEHPGPAGFIRAGGSYFFRLIRLGALAAPLYYMVYRFNGWLDGRFEMLLRDVTTERTVLMYAVVQLGLTTSLLVVVHLCFAYAKIATVLENRRSMLFAALRGVGFVASHPFQTLGLYVAFAAISLVALIFYSTLGPGIGQQTWTAVLIAFGVGQGFLILRLVFRLSLLGAEMALFQELTGKQRPVSQSTDVCPTGG